MVRMPLLQWTLIGAPRANPIDVTEITQHYRFKKRKNMLYRLPSVLKTLSRLYNSFQIKIRD